MHEAEKLKQRTKLFAPSAIQLYRRLPRSEEARIMGRQLMRSATSVAANYRAVCRSRSHAEFVAKMGVVVEEIDESVFWLELLAESDVASSEKLSALPAEAKELLAIFAASQRTAKRV